MSNGFWIKNNKEFFFVIVLQEFPMHLMWYQISHFWLLVWLGLCFATAETILQSGIFIVSVCHHQFFLACVIVVIDQLHD